MMKRSPSALLRQTLVAVSLGSEFELAKTPHRLDQPLQLVSLPGKLVMFNLTIEIGEWSNLTDYFEGSST